MKNYLKSILFVTLAELVVVTPSPAQDHSKFVSVSKLTPNLKVSSVEILDDKKTALSAKMDGQMDVRAEVRYGWFLDGQSFEGKPMMELAFSKSEKLKLPHLSNWNAGYYTAVSVRNGDELSLQLFTDSERRAVKEKKVMLLKKQVSLTLNEIEFGSACGMYYSVTAKVKTEQATTQTAALKSGMDIHC